MWLDVGGGGVGGSCAPSPPLCYCDSLCLLISDPWGLTLTPFLTTVDIWCLKTQLKWWRSKLLYKCGGVRNPLPYLTPFWPPVTPSPLLGYFLTTGTVTSQQRIMTIHCATCNRALFLMWWSFGVKSTKSVVELETQPSQNTNWKWKIVMFSAWKLLEVVQVLFEDK